ncbi:MAG: DUF4270 family protein [Agriterribacter sp.]
MKSKFLLLATGVLLSGFIYTGCTKITPTDIGTDLLPIVDNVNTFDTTLRVYADNYLFNDSSRLNPFSNNVLGIIENDPEFGKTEAQIYLSVVPASAAANPFTSVDSIVGMDSVVLGLAYAGLYADSNAIQKINVYEIADTSFKDTLGYLIQHPEFNTTGTELGSSTVSFLTLNDPKTIVVKGDTTIIENQMRIKLDPALGLRFAGYDTTVYPTASNRDSAFQKAFNGLALKVDASSPAKTALAYFDLGSENTKLTFYYRRYKNGVVDTVSTEFILYASSTIRARAANLIKRTPSGGYAGLSATTGVTDAEKVYIQSTPGSYAILRIPGLTGMSNRIVHRAELSFEPADSPPDNLIYSSPDYLFLDMIDSANNRFLTIGSDFIYSSTSGYDYQTFGGYLKDNRYFFNVTRHVQEIATLQTTNYPLRLYAPRTALAYYVYPREAGGIIDKVQTGFLINSKIAKGRAVIGGGSGTNHKMVLRIIYSKI